MNDIEFERLLSHKPSNKLENVPIRDLIFEYYLERFNGDTVHANKMTKAYTDELHKIFVTRKA